jgi:dethiobiotin synthetase
MRSLFITGTDTAVGKTIVTGLLGRYLRERARRVITQKWVQTGCSHKVPQDIACHYELMGLPVPVKKYLPDVAPYVFRRACSPHLAARYENKRVSAQRIRKCFKRLASQFDCVLVEGAGGVLVPYDDRHFLITIAKELDLAVLLVSQNRLGAINQTLMSVEVLKSRGLDIAGIVFNNNLVDEKYILKDNVHTVSTLSGVPVLGSLPYKSDKKLLAHAFNGIGAAVMEVL